jgi:hypothetical protein
MIEVRLAELRKLAAETTVVARQFQRALIEVLRERRLRAARADKLRGGRFVRFVPLAAVSTCSKPRSYSITSSAVARSCGWNSSPSALAVLRLITNSNLVDWITGRSAGFSPLRIRPT